jgi:hypothetical protein
MRLVLSLAATAAVVGLALAGTDVPSEPRRSPLWQSGSRAPLVTLTEPAGGPALLPDRE